MSTKNTNININTNTNKNRRPTNPNKQTTNKYRECAIENNKLLKHTKIYIDKFNPNMISLKILDNLEEFYKFSKKSIQIISSTGIFSLQNNKIIKLLSSDTPYKKIIFENKINLLLDDSFFVEEEVFSQIPIHDYSKQMVSFHYCQDSGSKLYLIIEGFFKCNEKCNDENNIKNKYNNFIIDNFYFLANEEIDNYLIKKELNVFLSMLI